MRSSRKERIVRQNFASDCSGSLPISDEPDVAVCAGTRGAAAHERLLGAGRLGAGWALVGLRPAARLLAL